MDSIENINAQLMSKIEILQKELAELRATEARLNYTGEKYRSVFEKSGAPAIIIEPDMTISMANPKFQELTGYSIEELEWKKKWSEFVAEEDRDRMQRYHNTRRIREDLAPAEYECRIVTRRGERKHIYMCVGMLPERQRSIASFIDITARKRAENALQESSSQLKAIIEAFEGFIYTCTADYQLDFMNTALAERIGHEAADGPCYQVIYGLDAPCPGCLMTRAFQGEKVKLERRDTRDGQWYYQFHSPIFSGDGSVIKAQTIIIDITERKRKEELLRQEEAHLRRENILLRSSLRGCYQFGNIVGKSQAMQEVYELILRAAGTGANVIIYGESGTGKELVARAIHDMSSRSGKSFVPVNCGAIPENLFESEFFGYRRGAFSGAERNKNGYLDMADGGTLFLDEMGEISLNMQVKLLRAIEGGGYTPLGSNEVRKPDVRIVAATNRDLKDHLRRGLMRKDFFYRIHIIPVHLPPLRERREDIPLLVDFFMNLYCQDKAALPVTGHIMATLQNYDWPGNVRELQNVLHRYATLNQLDLLESRSADLSGPEIGVGKKECGNLNYYYEIEKFERELLLRALEQNRWHREDTARKLGIPRRTFFRKLNRFGLNKA